MKWKVKKKQKQQVTVKSRSLMEMKMKVVRRREKLKMKISLNYRLDWLVWFCSLLSLQSVAVIPCDCFFLPLCVAPSLHPWWSGCQLRQTETLVQHLSLGGATLAPLTAVQGHDTDWYCSFTALHLDELSDSVVFYFRSITVFLNVLPGAFEDTAFSSLADLVSENTLKGVKEMGFEHMTEIQHKSIRPLLEGR